MYLTEEDKKNIKILEKFKRQIKLVDLQEIDESIVRRETKFLEDLLVNQINVIQYELRIGRRSEISTYIDNSLPKLKYWLFKINEKGCFPTKYNGVFYYYFESIANIIGATTPAKEEAFPSDKVAQLSKEVIHNRQAHISQNLTFCKEELRKAQQKDKFAIDGDYNGISDFNVGKKLNAALNNLIEECINLFEVQKLTQRKVDQLLVKFQKKFDGVILELDSEDRDYLKKRIDEITYYCGFRNYIV